jgi:ADP-ribose pyrophosphatase
MEKFMKPGVGGIIEKEIEGVPCILVQERCKEEAPSETGLLKIPAGKIREFENIYDCLRREIMEETRLEVVKIQEEEETAIFEGQDYRILSYEPFVKSQNTAGNYPIMVQVFICSVQGTLAEHTNETRHLRWLPVEKLEQLLGEQPQCFYPMHVNTLKKYLKHRSGKLAL